MTQIELNLEEYTNLLRSAAQEALASSSVRKKSGSLMNSISVKVGGTEDDPKYLLEFNDYGLFLDEGVAGTLGGTSAGGYQKLSFKYSGSFKMVGGGLPFGARTSIYKFGIKAKPWIASAIAAIEDVATKRIEQDLPGEIEKNIIDTINSVGTININV